MTNSARGSQASQGQPGAARSSQGRLWAENSNSMMTALILNGPIQPGAARPVKGRKEQPRAAMGNPKPSDLAESVRKNLIRQTSPQQKRGESITPAIKYAKSR